VKWPGFVNPSEGCCELALKWKQSYNSIVGARIIAALFLVAATTCSFTQNTAEPNTAPPRLIVDLPSNVAPEGAWIRYALYGADGTGGRISSGGTLKTEPNSRRQELSTVISGTPAQHAKLVIYVPGCQFGNYDIDLSDGSDITKHFQCEPLAMRTVHGFLPPNKIPTNTVLAEKKLDIAGYFDGDWVCRFFLQQRQGATIIEAGSCLSSAIPLGTLGQIDPAQNGAFEITFPDFTRDPVFDKFVSGVKFGVIQLALQEKKIGRTLATITANDAPEFGLNVQAEYRDPVIFAAVR
jgi:hypothetical protein